MNYTTLDFFPTVATLRVLRNVPQLRIILEKWFATSNQAEIMMNTLGKPYHFTIIQQKSGSGTLYRT